MKSLFPAILGAALAGCASPSGASSPPGEPSDGSSSSSGGKTSGSGSSSSSSGGEPGKGSSSGSSSGAASSSGSGSGSSSGSASSGSSSGSHLDAPAEPAASGPVASQAWRGGERRAVELLRPHHHRPRRGLVVRLVESSGCWRRRGARVRPDDLGDRRIERSDPEATARFLLGFNEPNFANQSDMTAQQAAQNWPAVEALAKAQGIPIVAPGVNFCGSASDPSQCADPNVTDPYTFLKDFFAACAGCEVDYIAVHWYNCDLPSLKAYIDGNDTLQGWVQFGKPIWLTEFCCDNSHSVADQQAYMQAAVPYLENNPHVFRYSWFSASPIPNALLAASDGSLTDQGQTYVSLPQACP